MVSSAALLCCGLSPPPPPGKSSLPLPCSRPCTPGLPLGAGVLPGDGLAGAAGAAGSTALPGVTPSTVALPSCCLRPRRPSGRREWSRNTKCPHFQGTVKATLRYEVSVGVVPGSPTRRHHVNAFQATLILGSNLHFSAKTKIHINV